MEQEAVSLTNKSDNAWIPHLTSDAFSAASGATLYDVLGVAETATPDEIKRAYYALVRQAWQTSSEDTTPLMEANRVLGDVRRRGRYDQQRRAGRRVQSLLDQAAAVLERDPQTAISFLKGAIALAPDMPRPRQLLAHTLMRVSEYAGAEKQYRWLLEESPRDETLSYQLARCLFYQERWTDTQQYLTTALRLNPCYHDALLLAARLQERLEQTDSAAQALEKAIATDNRENFADLDALLRLLVLYLRAGKLGEAERTAQRISSICNDAATADEAAMRLHDRAVELLSMGEEGGTVARGLLDAARHLVIATVSTQATIATLKQRLLLTHQARQANADLLLPDTLKKCLLARYSDAGSGSQIASGSDALSALEHEISNIPREIGQAVEYLRREYPDIASDQNALLQEIVTRTARRLQILGPGNKNGVKHHKNDAVVMPSEKNEASEVGPTNREAGRRNGLLGWLRGSRP